MIKKLLILLASIVVGTFLAFFAVLFLQDLILPVACIILVVIFGGWLLWIARGGMKKKG